MFSLIVKRKENEGGVKKFVLNIPFILSDIFIFA